MMNGTPTFEDFMQAYLPNQQAGPTNQQQPIGGMNGNQIGSGAPQSGKPVPGAPPSQPYYPQPVQIGGQNPGQSGFGGGMNGGQMGVGQYSGAPVISGQPQGQAMGPYGPHPQGGMNMQPGQSQAPVSQPGANNQMAQWIAMLQAMHGGAGASAQPQGISAHTGMGQAPQQPQTLANLIQGTAPVRQPGAIPSMGTLPQG